MLQTHVGKQAQEVQTLGSQGSATPCPLLWPLGLCPEAPWVPSAPVREAKGGLQCAQVQILIGQPLITSQGPSSSRWDRGAMWVTGAEMEACESLGTWDPRSRWAAGDHRPLSPSCYFLAWLWEQSHSFSVSPWELFSL